MARFPRSVGLGLVIAAALASTAATPRTTAQACSLATALPRPPPDRPHYSLTIRVARTLTGAKGTLSVSFAPPVATDRLVFRLWPNSPFYVKRGASLAVTAVTAGAQAAPTSRPDPTTLVVRRALTAGEAVTVSMTWSLRLPRPPGLQLHGGRSMRLLSFFPLLAWNGREWAPHETAHQWFYSLVGNDQSRDPWLSEGLATWAQTGPEQSLPNMLATAIPAVVTNRIGEPIRFWQAYDFETIRAGLYVQSVQALAELGDAAEADCALRRLVVENAYRTTVPRDLLAALEPEFPDADVKLRARGAHF